MAQEIMEKYRLRYKRVCWAQKNDPGKEEVCLLLTDDIGVAKKMATQEVIAAEHDVFSVRDAVLEESSLEGWKLIGRWPDW